jgi:folate-binding protein YgfZ
MGPDAKDFLHRLTTVHVKNLKVGQGARGFFLNPQGKIRVYFNLWNFGPDEYAFELDSGASGKWKNDLLSLIDQYHFGEKFNLADVSTLESKWIFPEAEDLDRLGAGHLNPDETTALDEEIRLCYHGSIDFGRPWFTAWGRPARLQQWADRLLPHARIASFEELEQWRIQALRPRVDVEISEAVLPLEIGLKDAIADNKGCYPGQEVIEKIVALGSPPRRLVQIDGHGTPPTAGSRIMNRAEPPIEVGSVTSVASLPEGRFTALGLIKKIHAKEGLEIQIFEQQRAEGVIIKVAPYA